MAHPYPTSRNETQQVPTYGLLSTTQQPQQTGRSGGEVSLLPPNNRTSGNGPRTDNPIKKKKLDKRSEHPFHQRLCMNG